jgi:hypothetical protein
MQKITIQLEQKHYTMLKEIILNNRTSGSSWFGYKLRRLQMLGVRKDLDDAIRVEAELFNEVMKGEESMICKERILEAYLFLRKNNHSIPSEVLDFILEVSLQALEDKEAQEDDENRVKA